MDKAGILDVLARGMPLFESLPRVEKKRICGTESEYGVAVDDLGSPIIDTKRLPVLLHNGGEVYRDCNHVEYASPEVSNAVAAVAFYEAGKVICWRNAYSPRLYCNNNDWQGQTFAAHENYFTCAPRTKWHKLVPFLIARTILCGAGWVNEDNKFEISQRASHIYCAMSENTLDNRGVVNLKWEPLADVPGWDRLHIICGDAGMSQISTFLRIGTMSLVLEMLELGVLPDIQYDDSKASSDIRRLSRQERDWRLEGVMRGPKAAVELLGCYLEQAKSFFSHRDSVTTSILAVWEDTLERLLQNPMSLWRRLDWVAKLTLLEAFKENVPNWNPEWLRSQDMEYHNLDPEKGLYMLFRRRMERLVSDELILDSVNEPPTDTRAYIRGKIAEHLSHSGGTLSLCANAWQHLVVVDDRELAGYRVVFQQGESEVDLRAPCRLFQEIPNPFYTYEHMLKGLTSKLE